MSRKRWIYRDGNAIEITGDTFHVEPAGPMIMPDLPGYQSQSGLWVEGRAQRREDLRRMGARPWEGIEQERKEAQRKERYAEQRLDADLTRAASEAYYQLPPSKRDILKRM